MYVSALGYWDARKRLSSSLYEFGDAPSVVGVLAFEILLKCVYRIELDQRPKFGHQYNAGWNELPETIRESILQNAKGRQGKFADFSDLGGVLVDLENAFVKARYSYEINENLSDLEMTAKGRIWADAGAPLDEADFRGRQTELSSLVFALAQHIQKWLGLPEDDILRDLD